MSSEKKFDFSLNPYRLFYSGRADDDKKIGVIKCIGDLFGEIGSCRKLRLISENAVYPFNPKFLSESVGYMKVLKVLLNPLGNLAVNISMFI